MEIKVTWDIIKTFVDLRNISIQWIDLGNCYELFALDSQLNIQCTLNKVDPPSVEQIDFETNYKDIGNINQVPQVTTQFEKRDKTIKLVHLQGDITEDGTVTVLLKVPGTPGSEDGRWISSGIAFFDVHTPGDKIVGVYFTDEDNILEYGAGTVVGSYTDDDADEVNRGWIIPPSGWVKAEAIGGYGFAPAGFYIKVIAFKAGESPSGKFYCNFEWGKTE